MGARPAVERYVEPMLINVDEILERDDPRVQLKAAHALARLVELLETARQDPDYVECVGDAELFKHLTWATAQVAPGVSTPARPPSARTAKRRAA
jgi:hypothetical protein